MDNSGSWPQTWKHGPPSPATRLAAKGKRKKNANNQSSSFRWSWRSEGYTSNSPNRYAPSGVLWISFDFPFILRVIWNFAPAYSENTAKSRVYLKLEINMRIHSVFVLIDARTRRIAPRLGAARAV